MLKKLFCNHSKGISSKFSVGNIQLLQLGNRRNVIANVIAIKLSKEYWFNEDCKKSIFCSLKHRKQKERNVEMDILDL